MKIARFTMIWGFLWILVYFVSDKVLKPNSISYLNSPLIFSSYFLGIGIIYSFIFRTNKEISAILIKNRWLLIGICISFLTITILIGKFIPISQEKINTFIHSGFLYPIMNFSTATSKGADVLFQQVLILSFIIRMQDLVRDKRRVLTYFGISFFLLHIPLVISMGNVAFLFIIPSTFAGFLFSYFILNYENGIIYSVGTHLYFYILLGLGLRYFV